MQTNADTHEPNAVESVGVGWRFFGATYKYGRDPYNRHASCQDNLVWPGPTPLFLRGSERHKSRALRSLFGP